MESKEVTSRNLSEIISRQKSLRVKMIFGVVFSLLLALLITAFINYNLGEFYDVVLV